MIKKFWASITAKAPVAPVAPVFPIVLPRPEVVVVWDLAKSMIAPFNRHRYYGRPELLQPNVLQSGTKKVRVLNDAASVFRRKNPITLRNDSLVGVYNISIDDIRGLEGSVKFQQPLASLAPGEMAMVHGAYVRDNYEQSINFPEGLECFFQHQVHLLGEPRWSSEDYIEESLTVHYESSRQVLKTVAVLRYNPTQMCGVTSSLKFS